MLTLVNLGPSDTSEIDITTWESNAILSYMHFMKFDTKDVMNIWLLEDAVKTILEMCIVLKIHMSSD